MDSPLGSLVKSKVSSFGSLLWTKSKRQAPSPPSMRMTLLAPCEKLKLATIWPMGPAPQTATTSPSVTPVSTTQWYEVARTSDKYNAFSSGTSSGSFRRLTSPYGTRTYSA